MDIFVDRDRTCLDRQRGFQDEPLARERAAAPIDENHRTLNPFEHHPRRRRVDRISFRVQVRIFQQCVHSLDVVLHKRLTPATANMDKGEPAAVEKCADRSYQRMNCGSMADDGVALQPLFQQAPRVHAVLSESDGSVSQPPSDQMTACTSILYPTVFSIISLEIRGVASSDGHRTQTDEEAHLRALREMRVRVAPSWKNGESH